MAAVAGIIAGIEAYTGDAKDQVKDLQKEIDNLDKQPGTIPAGPIPEKAPEDSSNYKQQLEEIKKKQDDITRASIDYFNQYRDSVADVRAKVNEEAKLVKLTEAEQNIQRDLSAFSQKYYDTIRPLQQQLLELKKSEKEEDKIKADEIQKQLGLITQLYNTSSGGLKAELELREQNRIAEETRVALMNNRRDLEEELTDLITKSKQELEDLDLNPFQLQIKELNRAVDDKLVASIRNIKSQWENGLISGDQYIKEIERLKEMANKSFEEIKKNAERTREIQRSFQYGWKQAFEAYVDDATNAAKAAQKIFEQTTKGIEDRIVDFVKTGKFEFRSLINDILETILRSQIQQLIAKTFGLFGKAGGSNIFGTMFAGFFANGGMIPSGSFGVVGERGPELVSGPAQVTPLAPSGSVTYNINAVDAASFKQMVARDPGFIHAVAQQGARKVPVRR
jgi:lambda family phage tail tape measure protein